MPKKNNVTRPSISESGMRIMRLLIGHPPQTIVQLIESLNITRTAVTEQIDELILSGYVERTIERCPGRGRPRYLFTATKLAMRHLFEGNQDIVVPAIWRSVKKHFGDAAVVTVCHDVAMEVAQTFINQISSEHPKDRMKEFVNILLCCGRLAEFHEKNGVAEIRKFNCPFVSMTDGTNTECFIDHLAMQKIVNAPLEVSRSRHDGHPCCTFVLLPGPLVLETDGEAV